MILDLMTDYIYRGGRKSSCINFSCKKLECSRRSIEEGEFSGDEVNKQA